MKKEDKFEDAPKGKLMVIDDFLPPPSQLVRKEDTVKVTISTCGSLWPSAMGRASSSFRAGWVGWYHAIDNFLQ